MSFVFIGFKLVVGLFVRSKGVFDNSVWLIISFLCLLVFNWLG